MLIFVSTNLCTQSSCFTHTKLTDKSTILEHHWLYSAPTNLAVNQGGVHLTDNAPWECQHLRGCPGHTESNWAAPWPVDSPPAVSKLGELSIKRKPSSHGLIRSQTDSRKYPVLHKKFCRSKRLTRAKSDIIIIIIILTFLPFPHVWGLGICTNTRVLICSAVTKHILISLKRWTRNWLLLLIFS